MATLTLDREFRDGAPAQLAGTQRDWRATLLHHYRRLGEASRRLRFLGQTGDRAIDRIAETSRPDAVLGIRLDKEIRGLLEIFRVGADHAEVAISFEDAYQGKGHGAQLFRAGLQTARKMGVKTVDLYFAPDNIGIRRLIEHAGGTISHVGSDCEAHIEVGDGTRWID